MRGVAWLSGGTLSAQAILILSAPILSRLYAPSDVGVLAVYLAVLVLGTSVASLRYETAIPLAKDEDEAERLVWLCVVLAFTTGLVLATALWFVPWRSTSLGVIGHWIWLLIPAGVFFTATFESLKQLAIRRRTYRPTAHAAWAQALTQGATQIGLALLLSPIALLLIIGDFLARVTAATRLLLSPLRSPFRHPPRGLTTAARIYRHHPMFGSGYALAGLASLQVAPLLFATLYDDATAGFFAMGTRVIGLPMFIIGVAVSQAFLGEGAKLYHESPTKFQKTFRQLLLFLLAFGLVALLPIALFGPWGFSLILGPAWNEAGVYAQILSLMFFLELICAPLASTLTVLRKQSAQFAWAISRLLLVITCFAAAWILDWTPRITVAAYGAAMALSFIALFAYTSLLVRRHAPTQPA